MLHSKDELNVYIKPEFLLISNGCMIILHRDDGTFCVHHERVQIIHLFKHTSALHRPALVVNEKRIFEVFRNSAAEPQ